MPFFFFSLFHVWQESCKNFSGEKLGRGRKKKIQKKQKGEIKAPHLQSKEGFFFFFFSGFCFFLGHRLLHTIDSLVYNALIFPALS